MSKRRHESLMPLSHQHHHGLVMSHRLQRDLPKQRGDDQAVAALAEEVVQFYDRDLTAHFAAEEESLFPVMEQHLGELAIIDTLRQQHRDLQRLVNNLRQGKSERPAETLRAFAALLRDHIRKEERILFVIFEEQLPESAAQIVGDQINEKLKS